MYPYKSIRLKTIFILLIAASFVYSLCACTPQADGQREVGGKENAAAAKNIILLIGDGMGFEQIEAGRIYNDKKPFAMDGMPYQGSVITNAYIKEIPTDSAAAATALATGNKVVHYSVAMRDGIPLKSITEYSMDAGKKTGIVATKDITDATPAAFSSHAPSRSNEEEIMTCQINSNIDLFMGQGKSKFDPYAGLLTSKGYTYVNTKAELEACDAAKIFATFDFISPQSEHSLSYLTRKAIDILSKENEKGFFLMVEGSKIDSACHANNLEEMIAELNAFDQAAAVALDFAVEDKNTLVIVVADHETGDLILPPDAGKQDLNNQLFHTGAHTSKKVPYFAYGPTADSFSQEIENTEIFVHMMSAFCFEITESRETGYLNLSPAA